jgi:hypothetical protein
MLGLLLARDRSGSVSASACLASVQNMSNLVLVVVAQLHCVYFDLLHTVSTLQNYSRL